MKHIIITLLLAGAVLACSEKKEDQSSDTPAMPKVEYPKTDQVDWKDNYFGTEVADPYRWLETPDSQAVTDWVNAQNEVTFSFLEKIPYREKIRKRLEEVWNYPRYSAPFKRGDHYFYYKNDGLQNQAVLYKMDDLEGEAEVFLDPNSFSEDGTVSLTNFSVSDDGKYAAYGKSSGGSDWNEFFVRNIETGEDLEDHLKWIKFSGASWKDDGFYYGRFAAPEEGKELAAANENKQIYFHKLGTSQEDDVLVFEDKSRPKMGIYASTTEDERYLLLYMTMGATNDNALSVRDLSSPGSPIIPLVEQFDHSYDVIDNVDNKLLVLTNSGASRYRLVEVDVNQPDQANWREIIPEQEEVLSSVSYVGGKLFARYMKDASSRILIYDLAGKQSGEVKLPRKGTVGGFGGKKSDTEAFYTFSSFTYPSSIFRYDVESGTSTLFRKSEVDFDPEQYEEKQIFFTSKDGQKVPMFVVHKKGIELNGKNPTFLYGYGGFNINILPGFVTANIPLLEAGGIYVSVNLRGGGEYGEDWHKAGMLDKKQNVFNDFIGAAEYLIENKYTSPEYLAIHGRSNGGLLVGATMCQRPELFKVAFPGVGVMDMLRFHKFTIGHAWVVEYGSSENEADFPNLYGYSPLHNLKEGTCYPATMVTTADHDDRVVPAHSFKFAAQLQATQGCDNPALIRIDTKAGHGAGKPTSMIIEEKADIWAFMFYNMGIEYK